MGDWDQDTTSYTSGSGRPSLFSKWRTNRGVGGSGGSVAGEDSLSYTASTSSSRRAGKRSGGSGRPSFRTTASSRSRAAESSSTVASADADDGGEFRRRNRSRSSSRPRTASSRSGSKTRGGGGEGDAAATAAPSSSASPRHRSRSRGKTTSREGGAHAAATTKGESLRDIWKKRAEETKSRATGGGAGEGSSALKAALKTGAANMQRSMEVSPGGGGRSVSVDWGEKADRNDDDGGSGLHQQPSHHSRHDPPPPPPRESHTSKRSTALDRRARSRSRGRSNVLTGSSGSNSAGGGRNVDSIASAIGHFTPQKKRGGGGGDDSTNRGRTRGNDGKGGSDGDGLSDLHRFLERASWKDFHRALSRLSDEDGTNAVASQMSMPHPRDGGTALHVAAWKAPPALAVQMIHLLPSDGREMVVLSSIQDGEGNTPLHLCCANLEYRGDPRGGGDDGSGTGESGVDCLAVLKELVRAAPPKAWTMQNSEGDTPLHMLVTSPLCASERLDDKSSRSSSSLSCARTALRAVRLALASGTDPARGAEAALVSRERTGATPLHVALAHGAHDGVCLALLDAAPSASAVEDERGLLPLHWAAAFGRTSSSVVRALVDEHPRALVHPSTDGDVPLHLAVSNAVTEDGGGGGEDGGGGRDARKVEKNLLKMVELLMGDGGSNRRGIVAGGGKDGDSSSPILMTNREKLTPLHCCALFDAPPQLSKLLMKHPDAVAASSMTNSFGATPLHLAAAQPGVSQSIATVLAIGTPEAAAVQDRLKRTPLHVAAQNTYATNLLIKTLAELNPDAASVKTQRGHLPLHLAAQSQAKEPVIRALIKAHPSATEARNKSNNTPLHDAAKYRASLGVVKLLLDACPGALYVQNQYGNLPLHCATAYQAPSEVVQLLLKSWPEGASMQNRNQDAPLHYAAAYAQNAAAVRPLIDAAPAAVLLLNSSGQSPVDRAKANNAPADIVQLLETAADDYSRNAASDGWVSFGQGVGP